ncbi:hypothetical protein [Streptomyces bluensis]|uniref:hypothetical protein n=1 Tax=Streptomyces bluensis TaxID=33897 RepID=UPI0016742001|nr:hypothetical protein [Streptomyces bluensis]GGZ92977.1 hypothetical protein GCM10010344_70920 [Streptomyces bluensis]
MPNDGTSGTTDPATRLARIMLPQRTLPVPHQLREIWLGTVMAEHQAALDQATVAGAQIVAVQMADREARRALLADWVRRHAAQFPDGQLYFDMHDVRRDGAGDPDVMLARHLRALGMWEEFIPARYADRYHTLQQVAAQRRIVIVVDGVSHVPEAAIAACAQGMLLVGSNRSLPGLSLHGDVVFLNLASPAPPSEDLDAAVRRLTKPASVLYRLLGHLPAPTIGPALARALLDSAGQTAITELTEAGLLVSAGAEGRFRLREHALTHARAQATAEPPQDRLHVLRQITDACLKVVEEAAVTCTSPAADDAERRAAIEVLDAEQHTVTQLMQTITHVQWHQDVWRLAMALRPLYDARVYQSYWQESHTCGAEAALWDGAIDVQAELRTQLAGLELLCGYPDNRERADKAIASAQEMLTLVTSDRLRGLIWQTRAELDEDRDRDPVPAWQQARHCYTQAQDHADAALATARLGHALVAAGRAEEALALLSGAAPSDADADLARASAYRALRQHGPALSAAVDAAEHAARHARYRLYGTALTLLAELAEELQDEELLQRCREKETELGQAAGLGPGRPAR